MTVSLRPWYCWRSGPLPHHLRGDLDRRVQMPDAPLRLVAHPLPVVAHVLGEPLRPGPAALDQGRLGRRSAGPGLRVDRRPASELGRDLDHRLVDEHRHRVEIAGVGLQPQALRLQRQGAASRKGIVEGRQPVRIEQPPRHGDDRHCRRRFAASSCRSPHAPGPAAPRWWCFPSGQAPRLGGTAARVPASGLPRRGTPRGSPRDRPPSARRSPPGPRPRDGAPTRDGGCWGARAGSISPVPRRR